MFLMDVNHLFSVRIFVRLLVLAYWRHINSGIDFALPVLKIFMRAIPEVFTEDTIGYPQMLTFTRLNFSETNFEAKGIDYF